VPTCSTCTVYTSPVSISSSTTIAALSCYPRGGASSVGTFTYTIQLPQPPVSSGGSGGTVFNALLLPAAPAAAVQPTPAPSGAQPATNTAGSGGVVPLPALPASRAVAVASSVNALPTLPPLAAPIESLPTPSAKPALFDVSLAPGTLGPSPVQLPLAAAGIAAAAVGALVAIYILRKKYGRGKNYT
jgi:hypothetical protein